MPNCVVTNCDYEKTEKGQYRSFLFPKDPEVRRKWLQVLRRVSFTPSDTSAICIRHFTEEDFEPLKRNRKKRKLKIEAVPSLFMAPEHEPPSVETRRSLDNIKTENDNLIQEVKDLKSKNQSQKETIENLKKSITD